MSDEPNSEPAEPELCSQCGHLWDPHLIKGYGIPPTEGWIECPEPGCTCHWTWDADEKSKADILAWRAARQHNDDVN